MTNLVETLIASMMFWIFTNLEKGTFNHVISFPNVWELLRLVMTHLATTETCEHIFSMMKLIRSDIRSAMTDQRINHLAALKFYPEYL